MINARNKNDIALQSRERFFGAPCTSYICSQLLAAVSLRWGSISRCFRTKYPLTECHRKYNLQ